jgi:hypothetical protein
MLKWIAVCLLIPMLAAGQVIEFEENDYIGIADSASLSFGDGSSDDPFTLTCWAYNEDYSGLPYGLQAILSKDGDVPREWQTYINSSGNIAFALYDNGGNQRIERQGPFSVPLYTWYHAALTYDGSSSSSGLKVYVNAVRVDNADDDAGSYVAMHDGANPVKLGKGNTTADPIVFAGKMDDVRIYNTALSSNEIARLVLKTCEMYDPTFWTNATLHATAETWETGYGNTNLVGAWRGDRTGSANGETFSAIPDISDNGNDGTAYNSPTIEAAR